MALALVASGQAQLPGDVSATIQEGDISRTYIVHFPNGVAPTKPLPLVLALHGYSGNAAGFEQYSGLAKEADAHNFIVVFPDGTGSPKGWNSPFFPLAMKGVDDVKFLTDLLDKAEKDYKVDLKRVYVCGHSNGAFMSYVMGSALSKRLAAIGVVAGTIGFDQGPHIVTVPAPESPVSAIIIHGKKDDTVPYDHMKGTLLQNCVPAPKSAEFWAKADGITAAPVVTQPMSGITETDYKGRHGVEVELWVSDDGTHAWPGGYGPSLGFTAADEIWSFFSKHTLGH